MRRLFGVVAAASVGWILASGAPALAQSYPTKPIRVVVPYPVGGAVDVMTRLVTAQMQQTLGQPVVVENRPGANANLGPDHVSKSAPDGYTVLATATYLIANPLVDTGLRWSPKELVPVARFTVAPNIVVVPGSSPHQSVQALVAEARARPRALNYGEAGPGAPQTMAIEMLKTVAGIEMQSVLYKGSPPVIADLINETLAMSVLPLNVVMGSIGAGKLKALASTSNRRSTLLPDVPTMAEAGFPEVTVVSWYGLHVPAGTPADVVARLSAAVGAAAAAEDVRTRTAGVGGEIAYLDTPSFEAFLREDELRWQRFVQAIRPR
jgi:tripartite-type tricarboxylate transporter receptor subunit TctC